jgi:hypothetical protein
VFAKSHVEMESPAESQATSLLGQACAFTRMGTGGAISGFFDVVLVVDR